LLPSNSFETSGALFRDQLLEAAGDCVAPGVVATPLEPLAPFWVGEHACGLSSLSPLCQSWRSITIFQNLQVVAVFLTTIDAAKVVPLCKVSCSTDRSGNSRSLPLNDLPSDLLALSSVVYIAAGYLIGPILWEKLAKTRDRMVCLGNSHGIARYRNPTRGW
jgi:hypothetical protein